ncbi:tetratricopeptide repeat-containing diguanylate cyclase [Aliikangiella sp. IMCC44359]|uniref:tetratricopeptide repeat-containing diguanylate cyclase n=1 Tax=Aliikangiella sp. IMCC44359 TaxID=3459125 RepID=UPI00403B1D20
MISYSANQDVKGFIKSLSPELEKATHQINQYLQENKLSEEETLEILYVQAEMQAQKGFLQKYSELAQEGVERAKKFDNFRLITKFKVSLASAYSQMARWSEAKQMYEEIISSLENSDYEALLGHATMNYGISSYYNQDFNNALTLLTTAYDLFLEKDKEYLSNILQNIGLIYDATDAPIKALAYFRQALSNINEQEDPMSAAIIYYNIGYTSIKINNFSDAELYLNKSLILARNIDSLQGVGFALGQLGQLSLRQEDYQKAKTYVLEALKISQQLNNYRLESLSTFQLLTIYVKQHNLVEAKKLFRKLDWHIKNGDIGTKASLFMLKSEMLIQEEKYKEAALNYQNLVKLYDSHQDLDKSKAILETQNDFENKIKQQEKKILQQENMLQQLEISEQKKSSWLYIVSSLGLLIIIFFLLAFTYRENKIKKILSQLALTDELTGTANRRYITQKAEEEFERFKRYKLSGLFCILDLDHFKKINDQFGHHVGDQVLISFAKLVSKVIRDGDHFGRIGGEEWLLVLPQTSIEHVKAVYQRLAHLCSEIKVPVDDFQVTFSMGVSIFQPQDKQIEDALKRADTALYQAKSNGRNCFVILP